MTPETRKALEGSIEKWRKIVDGTGVDDGPENCPLCWMFHLDYRDDGKGCSDCPVFEKTGEVCCSGTPYVKYSIARRISSVPLALAAARQELAFLESLRPTDE